MLLCTAVKLSKNCHWLWRLRTPRLSFYSSRRSVYFNIINAYVHVNHSLLHVSPCTIQNLRCKVNKKIFQNVMYKFPEFLRIIRTSGITCIKTRIFDVAEYYRITKIILNIRTIKGLINGLKIRFLWNNNYRV